MLIWDAGRRVLFVNDAGCDLLGCEREQIVGQSVDALTATLDGADQPAWRVIDRRDGTFLGVGGKLCEPDPVVAPSAGAEDLYLTTLDALSDPIIVVDESGTIIAANETWRTRWQRVAHYEDVFRVGHDYLQALDALADDVFPLRRELAAGVRDVLAGRRERFSMELPWVAEDQTYWHETRVTPLGGAGPRRIVVAVRGVTKLKQTHDALLRAREEAEAGASVARDLGGSLHLDELLQRIVGHARTLTDSDLSYIAVRGHSGERMWIVAEHGARNPAVLGRSFSGDHGLAARALETGGPVSAHDSLESPGPSGVEYEIAREEGLAALAAVPVQAGPDCVALLYVGQRAQRRYADSDLSLLSHLADQAVATLRNAALYAELAASNADLERSATQAKELAATAQEATALKSEFLATMSHEIRTPLAAVIGITDLLLATPLNEEQREFAGIARDSASLLLDLINDILDFSKMEAGKLSTEWVEFEPRVVVEEMAELLSPTAHQKHVSLATFVAPEAPAAVRGDAARLRQILLNLIGNAVKFTDAGEVVVRATVEAAEDIPLTMRFSVSDTGIGLSEVARRRLFQPFTQSDGSMARNYGGTGLGLAICKRLVGLLGGEIGVESEEGRGSTFWVTLPFAPVEAPSERADVMRLAGLRILVADADRTQREITQRYLAARGGAPVCATTTEEALALLQQQAAAGDPFDVVVVDRALAPDLGFEAASAATPVVLLSGFDLPPRADAPLRLGVAACVRKPVKEHALVEAVAEAAGRTEARDGTAGRAASPAEPAEPAEPAVPTHLDRRILVAEDNPVNQRVAALQLERFGYRVEVVSNGREAVEACERSAYALVLMDCQMPEMDGFEATRRIREREAGGERRVPIVALSANTMKDEREACGRAGMDDYLAKPVKADELRETMERWIAGSDETARGKPGTGGPVGEPVDRAILQGLRRLSAEGKPGFLDEVVHLYTGETPKLLRAMRDAIAAGDADALGRSAHALKGSSADLGASGLDRLCKELEEIAQSGALNQAPLRLAALEREYRRVESALHEELRRAA